MLLEASFSLWSLKTVTSKLTLWGKMLKRFASYVKSWHFGANIQFRPWIVHRDCWSVSPLKLGSIWYATVWDDRKLSASVLSQTIVNTAGKCFYLHRKRSPSSVPLIISAKQEKKARAYFKSDWTCFKANNSVSPIGHKSSRTHVAINNCLSRKRRNGRESRTTVDST